MTNDKEYRKKAVLMYNEYSWSYQAHEWLKQALAELDAKDKEIEKLRKMGCECSVCGCIFATISAPLVCEICAKWGA